MKEGLKGSVSVQHSSSVNNNNTITMEKQQNLANCDSMATTVTVKDYQGVDYQDPPPAYRNNSASAKMSPMVQTARIVAMAAVAITAMLSFAIVLSAWLSSPPACQYPQQQTIAIPSSVEIGGPEALKRVLLGDLDSAESKVENQSNNNKKDSASSSEEASDSSSGEDAVTMFRLPIELSLQEHMFERNQRSHMNCIIEKKKAEEIVDEQAKPLPPLLGVNMSTDPRYLHFTGEKMAISCDSGNDHRHAPHPSLLQRQSAPPPPGMLPPGMNLPSGSANVPIHIIGPIPINGADLPHFAAPGMHHLPPHPNLIPILIQQQQPQSSEEGPIFLPPPQHFNPHGLPPHHPHHPQQQVEHQPLPLANELRERALHQPIPIMPRQHFQHVIRPRSTDAVEDKKRVKRCACDCACKNHQD